MATKWSLADASASSRMLRSCWRWPGRNRWAMSRIAWEVRSVSASGSISRNVWPPASKVRHVVGGQLSVGDLRAFAVGPDGQQLGVLELGHGPNGTAGPGPRPQRSHPAPAVHLASGA